MLGWEGAASGSAGLKVLSGSIGQVVISTEPAPQHRVSGRIGAVSFIVAENPSPEPSELAAFFAATSWLSDVIDQRPTLTETEAHRDDG